MKWYYISVKNEPELHDGKTPLVKIFAASAQEAKRLFEECLQREVDVLDDQGRKLA